MFKALAAALLLVTASPAFAADAQQPVKAIMDLAVGLWSDDPKVEGQDYFDKTRLGTVYAKAFADAYREAAKHPLYDEGSGPFGYDVITNGQDGCPLKEVMIANQGEKAGITDIKVTFKLMTCYDDDPGKDATSEVHFDVVIENGRPVISDIHRVTEGKADSLLKEMQDIARNGGEQPADQNQNQQQEPQQK
ncbi:MAG: hypothetical protein JWM58_614 [Rhizobium sp.]|nr:hypothetical protein [Rhizobium sp.]